MNILDLDDYVSGVADKEISYTWPDEAIKAQAVIARTFAYSRYLENKKNRYHIGATDKDQVFKGIYKIHSNIKKNVFSVKDEILAYKGKPITAYFHSSCGGYTEEPQYVWNTKERFPPEKFLK